MAVAETDEAFVTRWFGESWGAPMNETCPRVTLPDDRIPCAGCDRPLLPVERGVATCAFLPYEDPHLFTIEDEGRSIPMVGYHVDCFMFGILGHGFADAIPDRIGPVTMETGAVPT